MSNVKYLMHRIFYDKTTDAYYYKKCVDAQKIIENPGEYTGEYKRDYTFDKSFYINDAEELFKATGCPKCLPDPSKIAQNVYVTKEK